LKKSQNQKLPNRFSFHGRGNYRTNVALPCAFIEDILGEERWVAKLKKEKLLLADFFSKKTLKDVAEEDELR
jgi:hypothetical protein